MKHYRLYAYPKRVEYVITRCTRKVAWDSSTDDMDEVSCKTCKAMLKRRLGYGRRK